MAHFLLLSIMSLDATAGNSADSVNMARHRTRKKSRGQAAGAARLTVCD
jgi:hypothetical protein